MKFERTAEILKTIGHTKRLQIVILLLYRTEVKSGAIAKAVGMKQSLNSQQITILRLSGIIKARRVGNEVYYSLVESMRILIQNIVTFQEMY